MTAFDYAVLAVIAFSLLLGGWRGVVSELLALLAWIAAFLAARAWGAEAGAVVASGSHEPLVRLVAGHVSVFVAVLVLFALGRWLATLLLKAVGLRPLDRLLGALFGIVRGVLVVWVLVLLAGLTALPQQAWWRQAWLAPPLETSVVAIKPWLPPDLAKRIHYR